ncbi:uncharacterized protein LTR77_003127 [Saxophila tyrrhenica]|uniref:Gfd2/YDR514C-like C-terminal domain-containing protein n=1 Tax=Saxophila tyrrhenica TaxID=1690608 RepID=A0AAV9PHE3_9PEZI|nr:hypothetical protein LTR77_003127 [Saxophila tyrrhenica]
MRTPYSSASHTYKRAWYGSRGWREARRVRAEFSNDREAYWNAYRPSAKELDVILSESMKAFRVLRASLIQQALETLLSALASGDCPPENYKFVAIDFEGTMGDGGVKEVGLAAFDPKHLFERRSPSATNLAVEGQHYAFSRNRSRGFLFGETVRTTTNALPRVVQEYFDSHLNDDSGGVILVGHSLGADTLQMDNYGVPVESLPAIVGTVDTT